MLSERYFDQIHWQARQQRLADGTQTKAPTPNREWAPAAPKKKIRECYFTETSSTRKVVISDESVVARN